MLQRGWAAFNWDSESRQLSQIPCAEFGEPLDPPSVDATAQVLEMYGRLGYSADHRAVRMGLSCIWEQQEHDGPWFGRWGVNFIYGTAAVLPALESLGTDMTQPRVRRAVQWLLALAGAGAKPVPATRGPACGDEGKARRPRRHGLTSP